MDRATSIRPEDERRRFRIVLSRRLSDRFLSSFERLSAEGGSSSTVIADVGAQRELDEVLEGLANLAIEVVTVEEV